MSISSFVLSLHLLTYMIGTGQHRTSSSVAQCSTSRKGQRDSAHPLHYCFAFFKMVPTAEMTVVLVPLAVVVTETTAGRVAVVVMIVGWASVTGIAESHLLFLFWASAGEGKQRRRRRSKGGGVLKHEWTLRKILMCQTALVFILQRQLHF